MVVHRAAQSHARVCGKCVSPVMLDFLGTSTLMWKSTVDEMMSLFQGRRGFGFWFDLSFWFP